MPSSPLVALQPAADFEAVDPGHHHVQHHEVRRALPGDREGRVAVRRDVDGVPLERQAAIHQAQYLGVVIHHQHARTHHAHRSPPVNRSDNCGGIGRPAPRGRRVE